MAEIVCLHLYFRHLNQGQGIPIYCSVFCELIKNFSYLQGALEQTSEKVQRCLAVFHKAVQKNFVQVSLESYFSVTVFEKLQ